MSVKPNIGRGAQVARDFQHSMEALAQELQGLILDLPATLLLGYLWTDFAIRLAKSRGERENHPKGQEHEMESNNDRHINQFAFTMEYIHAVLSCNKEGGSLDMLFNQEKVEKLLDVSSQLHEITQFYCMASSGMSEIGPFGPVTGEVEFFAKTSWVNIRGNRNQVLEAEFFQFILAPHDEALQRAYGVEGSSIAAGIQSIADSMRTGLMRAFQIISEQISGINYMSDKSNLSFEKGIKLYMENHPKEKSQAQQAMADLFYGGVCNLSAHTYLPETLLEDLAFSRGDNKEFYAPGDFCGTPMRTLPARVRPLVRLDDGYYAMDPSFVRDSSYRVIQRALIRRIPQYREEWNLKQKVLTERAFERIFAQQLAGAKIIYEVYYKDPITSQWVENDALILLDDVMIQIEAKAGVAAMHSPATDFDRHVRAVQDLVLKAYRQTRRFLEYATSAQVVPLFELRNGSHVEIHQLCISNYRTIIPIGLTVEAFTPFSAMCKELPEVEPLLKKYPFISMSIDDLFVLTRFLPTTGDLVHYLEVRQQVAGLRGAFIFDELDHLGAYIDKNRFDMDIRKQLAEGVNVVTWTGFSQVVSEYFGKDQWQQEKPPNQDFPVEIKLLFSALATTRKPGWLKVQSLIRDLSAESRTDFATTLSLMTQSLSHRTSRWFMYSFPEPLMIWMQRGGGNELPDEGIRRAEILAIAINRAHIDVLYVTANHNLAYEMASLIQIFVPPPGSRRRLEAEIDAEKVRRAHNG